MPRAEGQKAKLLVLKQIFERKTDEEHMLSVPQLLDALEKAGMPAERKSIYSDIDALRRGGVDGWRTTPPSSTAAPSPTLPTAATACWPPS